MFNDLRLEFGFCSVNISGIVDLVEIGTMCLS